eukprot:10865277-Lingulodinium_polyedra.AAC.1
MEQNKGPACPRTLVHGPGDGAETDGRVRVGTKRWIMALQGGPGGLCSGARVQLAQTLATG